MKTMAMVVVDLGCSVCASAMGGTLYLRWHSVLSYETAGTRYQVWGTEVVLL